MSKEQIIDEVYGKYKTEWLKENPPFAGPYTDPCLTQEEFINKCKTDPEFSEKWGLKIEKRELSLVEMIKLAKYENAEELIKNRKENIQQISERLSNDNIPTKLITVKYKNETIESYE